jgi:predicted DNA-binding protein (UPF0251 family)
MHKGRRKKIRYIQRMPKTTQFSPRGYPGRPDEVELKVDHFEAIKLADYQGHSQSEGACAMGISRPTFGRILREGRKIIADALANGKIIRIRTGNVQVGIRREKILNKPNKEEPPSIISDSRGEEAVRKRMLEY